MPRVGSRLGGFSLTEHLGAGGFGVVYRGEPDVGPVRAIKVLTDPNIRVALRREAEALAALDHPNVVRLVQADLRHDPPFLVMELVEGGPLPSRGPLEEGRAEALCRDILAGLAHAHALGVAHLDLKPQNVLLGRSGAKIADFGLARALTSTDELEGSLVLNTREGTSGTLSYMAPEQHEGQAGDCRSDLYSFGVMLAELISGKRPQPGDTLRDLMGREPPPWASAVFGRCYCRYEKRFSDASEALAVLEEAAGASAVSSARAQHRCEECGSSFVPRRGACPECGCPVGSAPARGALAPAVTQKARPAEVRPRPGARIGDRSALAPGSRAVEAQPGSSARGMAVHRPGKASGRLTSAPPAGGAYCRTCGRPGPRGALACLGCGCRPTDSGEFCPSCGAAVAARAILCVGCGLATRGAPPPALAGAGTPPSRATCALLAFLLPFGIHRFLMGYSGVGLAQLLSTLVFVLPMFWSWIDGILILSGGLKLSDGRELT